MIKPKAIRSIVIFLSLCAIVLSYLSCFEPAINGALVENPIFSWEIDTYGDAWEGYLAFGLWKYNTSNIYFIADSYLVITNTNGDLITFRESSADMNYLIVNELAKNMLMYQGDPYPVVHFWNVSTGETVDFEVFGHHDIEYNADTETFLTLRKYIREVNGTRILLDEIVELNATGQTLWTWDTYNYLNLEDACTFGDTAFLDGELLSDFTHSNTLRWSFNENLIYLNVRNLNTFYAINKTTGELIWSCGEHGDFQLFNKNGTEVTSLWYHGHSIKEVEENVFIIFDNDFHNKTNPENAHSRILEFTIDEENMTARESWSWISPKDYWSPYWGDADRLPNGNRIGVFGSQIKQHNNSIGAVFVEVNPEGQVVRTYTFPRGWGVYRLEEISSLGPLLTPVPTATPSPTPSPTVTPSPSPTPSPTATPSPSPTPTASPSPSPTPTTSPSPSPLPEEPPTTMFFAIGTGIGALAAVAVVVIFLRVRK